jgi:hypothetical protein
LKGKKGQYKMLETAMSSALAAEVTAMLQRIVRRENWSEKTRVEVGQQIILQDNEEHRHCASLAHQSSGSGRCSQASTSLMIKLIVNIKQGERYGRHILVMPRAVRDKSGIVAGRGAKMIQKLFNHQGQRTLLTKARAAKPRQLANAQGTENHEIPPSIYRTISPKLSR